MLPAVMRGTGWRASGGAHSHHDAWPHNEEAGLDSSLGGDRTTPKSECPEPVIAEGRHGREYLEAIPGERAAKHRPHARHAVVHRLLVLELLESGPDKEALDSARRQSLGYQRILKSDGK